jgi:hypothetical protein
MITTTSTQTRSLCRGFFRAGTVSPRRSRIYGPFGAEVLWLRPRSFRSGCFRLHRYGLNSGIARTMNSSNKGTVNAMSPCAGL